MPNYLALFSGGKLAEIRVQAVTKELLALSGEISEHGITVSEADCRELAEFRRDVLIESERIETGLGAVGRIATEFADSGYVDQQNFVQVVEDLTECFYTLKNETEGKASDDQVMEFLHYLFETAVGGDTSRMYEAQAMDDFVSAMRGDLRYKDPEDDEKDGD
ncbi:MAG: hypothetical protein IJY04_03945 [Clostridia bacterium]|nr:hypothetical protein [Clostridia bacterium]